MKNLHVYDFDQTLYDSSFPPKDQPNWRMYTRSLQEVQAPGFDRQWNMPLVIQARRSSQTPGVVSILVTARPDYREMRERIESILSNASLDFEAIYLKPVYIDISDWDYKAAVVATYTDEDPSFRKVVVYDDDARNHIAIRQHVERRGLQYDGHLVRI